MADACPFCSPLEDRIAFDDALVRGLWDEYPVSPGYLLIVPKRHVATWFDATVEEQVAMTRAMQSAREAIEALHSPDGYNAGINIGEAAGQTVFHLHLHLIPRYRGDVEDPRGGVRHLFPDRAAYWDPDR